MGCYLHLSSSDKQAEIYINESNDGGSQEFVYMGNAKCNGKGNVQKV